MKFVQWMDELPYITKILFCLPFLDVFWAIYRIVKGGELKNNGLLIIGVLWIVFGWNVLWIIDMVTTIIQGKPVLTDAL